VPEESAPRFLSVGLIIGPFGIRGEMKVEPHTERPGRFAPGAILYLDEQPVVVESSRRHQGRVLLKIKGVDNPNDVEPLRNKELEIPRESAPPPAEGEYYYYEIIGCEVFTEEGRLLGRIAEIIPTAANDVYVVRGGMREILLPAIEDVVKRIDPGARRVEVEAVPGLLDDWEEPPPGSDPLRT
jgi:16S rRNA processing protein RimM